MTVLVKSFYSITMDCQKCFLMLFVGLQLFDLTEGSLEK